MVLIHLMIYVECAKTQNCTTGSKEMDSREEGVYDSSGFFGGRMYRFLLI